MKRERKERFHSEDDIALFFGATTSLQPRVSGVDGSGMRIFAKEDRLGWRAANSRAILRSFGSVWPTFRRRRTPRLATGTSH